MSIFTKRLDKTYGAHSLTAILASDVDEPKKEEPKETPSAQPDKASGVAILQLAS